MGLHIDFEQIEICMLTSNEELLLEFTLSQLRDKFSRFAIIDQSSSDRTVEIIRDILGNKVALIVEPNNNITKIGFAGARNRVSEICSREWVLHVDADEQIVFGADDTRIVAAQARAGDAFLNVGRRNLGQLPDVTLPLDAAKVSRLPVESEERHIRLYKRNVDIRWHSFIHEELWQNGRPLAHHAPGCNLFLNHLSRFKGYEAGELKEDFYGWMMMEGLNRPPTEEDRLSDYSMSVMLSRKAYFEARAAAYARTFDL